MEQFDAGMRTADEYRGVTDGQLSKGRADQQVGKGHAGDWPPIVIWVLTRQTVAEAAADREYKRNSPQDLLLGVVKAKRSEWMPYSCTVSPNMPDLSWPPSRHVQTDEPGQPLYSTCGVRHGV
ncbi:uncharacterized protein KY384_004212 [Bacidia gigantensis]|uniref:uncharacterized protein n=1 Tax=Bacidia gigantensis TaxID=2732470 RepID=UPI001D052CA3|nr:uncharacterized protein KY384_004212 [Bacidia gigantensis]KAG8530855.1 hypothetical protein KY384_004212 [Bacidia gigantensis]